MLKDFEGYLSKKIGLKEKYVPYYVIWVDNCYRFFKKDKNEPLSGEQQRKFLKYLSESYEDWQIKQADKALRHYNYFLSQKGINHDDLYPCREKECPGRKKSAGLLILC